MTTLPYSPLPLHHPARAWTASDQTDIARNRAEFIEQHSPILVCPVYGDDYDEVERTAWIETPGAFKP